MQRDIMPVLSPTQLNTVIEDKLSHLLPTLEYALRTFERTSDALANGQINWRKLFDKAKAKLQ
jgi:hypothetical protein